MNPKIPVSQHDLALAFAEWEREHRSGKCLPYDPTFSESVYQVAQENAKHFFIRLLVITGRVPAKT